MELPIVVTPTFMTAHPLFPLLTSPTHYHLHVPLLVHQPNYTSLSWDITYLTICVRGRVMGTSGYFSRERGEPKQDPP